MNLRCLHRCDAEKLLQPGHSRDGSLHAEEMDHTPGEPPAERPHWSQQVSRRPPALNLEPGLFRWNNPERIAESLWHSAQSSQTRQRSVYASAMAMLCLYINRAGRKLEEPQRQILEEAKQYLRRLQKESAVESKQFCKQVLLQSSNPSVPDQGVI